MNDKFKRLVEGAERILLTSHISPDPDAVSSLLLMGTALKLNYPDKELTMVLEEEPINLDFLDGYNDIEFKSLLSAVTDYKPELFVLLDANNYERCSRHDGQKIRDHVESNKIKTIVLDHHELAGKDQVDLFVNNKLPACVEEVYRLCFHGLKLKLPDGYAKTTIAGLYADTGGFVYLPAGSHKRVFELVSELIDAGANIEQVKNLLTQYRKHDLKVLSEIAANVFVQDDYTYCYLSDKFIDEWEGAGHTLAQLQPITGMFLNDFIRNIEGRQWGFMVYKNTLQGEGMYSVSLRSVGGVKDVSLIAGKLGGGGHKPAAGGKFAAGNVDEAIEKVKAVIAQTP